MIRSSTIFCTLALAILFGGCAAVGVVVRKPMVEVRDESVHLVPGTYLSDVIVRAAQARKWSASVTGRNSVRCSFEARSWSIVVDVLHEDNNRFSIVYVASSGLFYLEANSTIHGRYNNMVNALRLQIAKEAAQTERLVVSSAGYAQVALQQAAAEQDGDEDAYRIESFEREQSSAIAYRFTIVLENDKGGDMETSKRIQSDIRKAIAEDCKASHAMDESAFRIDFTEYAMRGNRVEGRAVVFKVDIVEFVYDPQTRHGRLAVRIEPGQYEATRNYVRSNIADIVNGSGHSGKVSRSAKYSTGREMLRDDNVLEVEFFTGD